MAFVAGKDQYLTFNTLNLTSGLASEVKMAIGSKELDCSTIGSNWEAFVQGQSNLTISVSGVFDDGTATTNLDSVLFANANAGGTKLYEFAPGGSASNKILYKGNMFVTAYEIGGPVGDKVPFSASFRGAGSPIRTVIT